MKNLITKLFMDKDIIILLAAVILVIAVIIIINIPKNNAKNNPVRFYKNNFFMLKDKVNNIYVYVYEHKKMILKLIMIYICIKMMCFHI